MRTYLTIYANRPKPLKKQDNGAVEHIFTVFLLLLIFGPIMRAETPPWFLAMRTPYIGQQAAEEMWAANVATAPALPQRPLPVTPPVACPVGYTCTPNPPQPAPPAPPPSPRADTPVTVTPSPVSNPAVFIPAPGPITYIPQTLITVGGGFASPNGKFAYEAVSTLTGPQNTYLTAAQEFTILKGKVQSCTLGGLSKPLYQFGPVLIGMTGLGGGCAGTGGNASAIASGQGFLLFRFAKTPYGLVITAIKNSTGGFKVTAGVSWGK